MEAKNEVIEWKYYVGVKKEDEKMPRYLRYLNAIGFITFTKPLKKIKITSNEVLDRVSELIEPWENDITWWINRRYIYKANFDVEITADILSDKSKIEEIILFSGDSDFTYLVKKIKDVGKSATIYSSRKTIAWELKLETPHLSYLEDIKEKIKRQ